MEITRHSEALREFEPADPAHFTGPAALHQLVEASPRTGGMFAAIVRFEVGTRNHWHSHAGGQLLHVIEGEGWIQRRGRDPVRLVLEDTVWTEPGEEHWHGASRRVAMTHLAVAVGETRWLDVSPAPPD